MNAPAPSIGKRTAQGAGWLIASRLMTRGVDFITLTMLSRALLPQDFGLVAIAMALVQLVEAVLEMPITQVLVRAHSVDRAMENTTFTLGLIRALVLAGVLGALAWPAAALYHDARLGPLLLFLALAPVLRGLQSPAMAHYARAMNFRPDLWVEVGGKIGAFGAALAMVLATRSYWAIAAGTVAGPAVMLVLSYALAPMRPRLTLACWQLFGGFIGATTAAQVLSAVNWQIDRLLLSRFVAPARLGAFTMASDLASLPFQALVTPMLRPLISGFSIIHREQGDLARRFMQGCAVALALTLPFALGLGLLADPVVRLVLGPQWAMAAPWLQWLAPLMVLALFQTPFSALAMATGRNTLFWRINLVELTVKLPVMVVLIGRYGVAGALVARVVTAVVMMLVYGGLIHRLLGLGAGAMIRALGPVLGAGAVMAAVVAGLAPHVAGLGGLRLALALSGVVVAGAASYGGALWLSGFAPMRAAGNWAVALMRARRERR